MTQKHAVRMAVSLLLLASMLIANDQLAAGVYKWTDEHGHVHFSDRPVTGESTQIKIKEQSTAVEEDGEGRMQKTRRMLDVYQEDRAAKKEANEKQKREKEKRKKNCLYAKDRYASHNRASGIYNYGKDGDRSYLSDEERNRHMQQLKAAVKYWCK